VRAFSLSAAQAFSKSVGDCRDLYSCDARAQDFLEVHDLKSQRTAALEADSLAATGAKLPEEQTDAQKEWAATLKEAKPDAKEIEKEIATSRSGYGTIFQEYVPINVEQQSQSVYKGDFWDATGMMLLGMSLMKLGVFSGGRSRRFYALMTVIGYSIGVPLNAHVAYDNIAHNFDVIRTMENYLVFDLGRLTVALGHIGVVMLVCQAGIWQWLTSRLAAVGQMALTNYVMQTLICTLLFYGHGFGLFGRFERYQLYGIVAAIWILQLIVSPLWLRFFRFGPLEWAWRSLTYRQKQPMRNNTVKVERVLLNCATV
jgi:uncharacterized protein